MIRITVRQLALAAAVIEMLPAAAALGAIAPPEVRPIIRSNQTAAGAGAARFLYIEPGFAAVNDQGQVAFAAGLTGSGVNSLNDQGIWLSSAPGGPHSLVARFGGQPPGLPAGTRFAYYFESLHLNNAGDVAFVAGVEPALQPVETGAWTTAGGPLRLLAADRYPIPGAPAAPAPTGGVYFPLLNDAGQTSFFTGFNNPTLWVDTPGQPLRRVVAAGDVLPGAPGMQVKFVGPGLIDRHGHLAFGARVAGPGDPVGSLGLWSETGGTLQLVAREGGTPPNLIGSYQSIIGAAMNDAGQLAFDAFVTSPSGSRLIAAQRPDGSLRTVAQTHRPLPGTSQTLANLYTPSINAHGRVAFLANLASLPAAPGSTSVWAENDAGLALIARAGQLAPGAGGALFEGFEHIQFNDHGELLFEAYLTQGVAGVTHENDQGLWLHTRNGRITLIAREGDFLDIDPGPAQNLQRIFALDSISALPNLLTWQRRTLTNHGEVLFHANFQNGTSGLFLSQPVPEPSPVVMALLALIPCLITHRATRATPDTPTPGASHLT